MTSVDKTTDYLWVFLLLVFILGLIGHACVLTIYLKKEHKKPLSYLTIVLASTDLLICLIIIPTQIIIRYVIDPLHSPWVCNFIFWYCYGFWGLSCLNLCLIAFERFVSVCQHHRLHLSRCRILTVTGIALAVSFTLSLSPAVYSRFEVGNATLTCVPGSYDVTGFMTLPTHACDDRHICPTVLFATYLFMIVFNSVIYSVIFWTLRKYEREWKIWNSRVTPMRSMMSKHISVSTIGEQSDESSLAERFPRQHSSRANQSSRMESQADYSSKMDQHGPLQIQYSKMISKRLLLVNLTYLLSWIPFYLTQFRIIPYYDLLHNLFFIANFINPYIYMITNPLFRKQVSVLCCH